MIIIVIIISPPTGTEPTPSRNFAPKVSELQMHDTAPDDDR